MTIWKIDMEDLTHLGGPMGTEYTTSLGSKVFKDEVSAIKFMNEKSENQLIGVKTLKHGQYFDCRWIGFKVEKEEL